MQHVIPSFILFKIRKILGQNVGQLIMDQILYGDKLCLAQEIKLLPGPWSEDELKATIFHNTGNVIKKLPPLSSKKEGKKQ